MSTSTGKEMLIVYTNEGEKESNRC